MQISGEHASPSAMPCPASQHSRSPNEGGRSRPTIRSRNNKHNKNKLSGQGQANRIICPELSVPVANAQIGAK